MNLFTDEIEQQAIERIQKFEKIAKAMGFEVILGFSGGKDSQVCYDLCKRSGITFKACFNHCFESQTTLKFIREIYPDVIKRRNCNFGFIENITVNHNGLLPTVRIAYCCAEYKHNPKSVEECAIVGVRRSESARRKARTLFEIKNKTLLKKNKSLIDDYFEERCQSTGTNTIIQLKPIIDWSDNDVWDYIKRYKLPINPEYNIRSRIGCIVCPKASFTSNYIFLIKYPKLINAFIRAIENSKFKTAWVITHENKDCSNDKCYYICRWLNHSFMPFTKKQEALYEKVKEKYMELKSSKK